MSLSQRIGFAHGAVSAPLYLQLQRALREAIQLKVLSPDDALPPERDMADDFNVSRITVRKALEGLVNEGLLTRRQGAGTFVAARVEKNFSKLTCFTEDMISRGRAPHSEWITRAEGAVTPEEALMLGVSPNTPVYRFHRIRFADGAPMAVEYTTIAAFALPSPEVVKDSLYEAMATHGHRPARALQALQIEINRVLATFQEIAVGNDTKRFVKVNSFLLSPLSFISFMFVLLISGCTFLYSLLGGFLSLFCLGVGLTS